MIIDDNDGDQFYAKVIIEKFDPKIEILQAYDGQEALDMLADIPKQPDVIFLDINMPRMDGHEFLKVNDERKEKTSAIILMLTSSDQEKDRDRSMAYQSVRGYITKPLEVINLEEAEKLLLSFHRTQ